MPSGLGRFSLFPCCLCGIAITPNPSNMCVNCLKTQVDITEGIQKQVIILWCKECGRYLNPPRQWVPAQLESKELLTFCVKRLKNLSKVKLIDAGFQWTEPHSKRLKVKLTIQKDVMNGAILQQSFVVEYVVEYHMCDACNRVNANPNQWKACVQLRQHVEHKRTFLLLEQLILKHNAAAKAIAIKEMYDGIDFFFGNRSHGTKFLDFLQQVAPVRFRTDKQLVSHDEHTSTYNYKFTFSVEIAPVCKDDLVFLPRKLSTQLGGVGPFVLVLSITNSVQVVDPLTARVLWQDTTQYWKSSFRGLLTVRQLTEYIVLDIEPVDGHVAGAAPPTLKVRGGGGSKFVLADATVARTSDFGRNDTVFHVRTHLGHLLHPGDHALGYDLFSANLNDTDVDEAIHDRSLQVPDVILVKKSYQQARKQRRNRSRAWKLRELPKAMEVERSKAEEARLERDRELFLEDLEEDPELRARIALFRDPNYIPPTEPAAPVEEGEEEVPEVPLDELLDELTNLTLQEQAAGAEGDDDEEEDEGEEDMETD
eukprot:jgi/Mesvir1/26250/Mv01615-RA.1